ncbi:hypothetical protein QBC42DRAFT_41526 [Cladorrhinum samala]|uniref:Uncharacterized protein n=1 Tax=Cladorrhinum samala TaxID=585594 RepID=A0AAV9I7H8_9PEZI|nr:hypothetical protein QBC42DRAFT_41526 [Cladorrhinum samala]
MPPPIVASASEAEDSSNSDSDSDSSTEIRDPLKEESPEPTGIGSDISDARANLHGNHAIGKLVNKNNNNNNVKRKADSQPVSDHAFKSQRTSSYGARESGYSSYGEEGSALAPPAVSSTSYVQQSFTAAPMPIVVGKTRAIDLYRQTYPHLPVPERPNDFIRALAESPIKRIPNARDSFNDKKPQNMPAYFMQACGDVVPPDQACERCVRRNGAFTDGCCVVVQTKTALSVTDGACANCWYNRQGSICTLRHPERRVYPTPTTSTTPIPIPQIPAAAQRLPSTPLAPATAAAPLHPSYAAALAASSGGNSGSSKPSSPAFTPQTVVPPTVTSVPPPKPVPATATATTNITTPAPGHTDISKLLRDATRAREQGRALIEESKTSLWEARYRAMSRPEVIAAYQELLDLQEDLTIKMRAMNHVVLGRLKSASVKPKG